MSNTDFVSLAALDSGEEGNYSLHPYVDWHAIIAGSVVAVAIFSIMTTFGIAVGLSVTSPFAGNGLHGMALAIATGLWVLWVAISSFVVGGYLTGRLRRRIYDASEHESDIRDGSHGLIVWALGSILLAAFTTFRLEVWLKTPPLSRIYRNLPQESRTEF